MPSIAHEKGVHSASSDSIQKRGVRSLHLSPIYTYENLDIHIRSHEPGAIKAQANHLSLLSNPRTGDRL